jgi:hypothetical protein
VKYKRTEVEGDLRGKLQVSPGAKIRVRLTGSKSLMIDGSTDKCRSRNSTTITNLQANSNEVVGDTAESR